MSALDGPCGHSSRSKQTPHAHTACTFDHRDRSGRDAIAQHHGTGPDAASFLVAGMAQGQGQQVRSTAAKGFGFGVKGGVRLSSSREADSTFKKNHGWEAGIFTASNYYLKIPVLLWVNIGSSNRNTGAIVYGVAGPVADILPKADLNGVDVKKNYESVDLGIIAGGGAARDVKTRSFAILGGVRFNESARSTCPEGALPSGYTRQYVKIQVSLRWPGRRFS